MRHKHADVFEAAARGEADEWEVHGFGWPQDSWQAASEYPNLDSIYNKPGSWESRRKEKTHVVNGFTVPKPLRVPDADGSAYFVESLSEPELFDIPWTNVPSPNWIKRGIVHATKEGAIANCKARLGIDPYKDES